MRSPLRLLDATALSEAAQREARARQRHLPPVSVYRWWARRTETVTGAIVDALEAERPGRLTIADPFAGGGVIALAALLRGHQVYAQDVNPWAARCLTTMLRLPAPEELAAGAAAVHSAAAPLLGRAYATALSDGSPGQIAHTLRVATSACPGCARTIRLFPTALVSLTARVETGCDDGYLACPAGHLNHASAIKRTTCSTCGRYVKPAAKYTPGRVARCVWCRWSGPIALLAANGSLQWEPVLVERCGSGRREIGPPTPAELTQAESGWFPERQLPRIHRGTETAGLLRHGFAHWHDLYPARQRVVLEALLSAVREIGDGVLLGALEAAVIGTVEMAGFASRWDSRYLKAYEAVANHRYNFTTLAAEPNVWGAGESGRGTVNRRLQHLEKASIWLAERTGRRLTVEGPLDATGIRSRLPNTTDARVVGGSSQRLRLPARSLDAVVTDPPYHDDVHYTELSDLFRSWAEAGTGPLAGDAVVKRLDGTDVYEQTLCEIFGEVQRALRPGAHMVLSYANREPRAWAALIAALQAAGFRSVGFTVVTSENDSDHAKLGRRACNLDILVDVVVAGNDRVEPYEPAGEANTPEAEYCRRIGSYLLRIGDLSGPWREQLITDLLSSEFLQ